MRFSEYLNDCVRKYLDRAGNTVIIGQNVAAGSHLGGLTRDLASEKVRVINSPNSESALVGIALGCASSSVNCLLWLKQQDFLYLGMDALINTVSLIRNQKLNGRGFFSLVATVMDAGWEGPQASGNLGGELGRITSLATLFASGPEEAKACLALLPDKEFSILLNSQKINSLPSSDLAMNGVPKVGQGYVSYGAKSAEARARVLCFNFSFQETYAWARDIVGERFASLQFLNIFDPASFLNSETVFDGRPIILVDDSRVSLLDERFLLLTGFARENFLFVKREDLEHFGRPQDLDFRKTLDQHSEQFLGLINNA